MRYEAEDGGCAAGGRGVADADVMRLVGAALSRAPARELLEVNGSLVVLLSFSSERSRN